MNRPTIDAIELAWWGPGRAFDVALQFKGVSWRQVARIWIKARARGEYLNAPRPAGGWPWSLETGEAARNLHRCMRAQPAFYFPPITAKTKPAKLARVA